MNLNSETEEKTNEVKSSPIKKNDTASKSDQKILLATSFNQHFEKACEYFGPTGQITKRKIVFITARAHAAEVSASHMLSGMIEFLISDKPLAKKFRSKYIVVIVPMLN